MATSLTTIRLKLQQQICRMKQPVDSKPAQGDEPYSIQIQPRNDVRHPTAGVRGLHNVGNMRRRHETQGNAPNVVTYKGGPSGCDLQYACSSLLMISTRTLLTKCNHLLCMQPSVINVGKTKTTKRQQQLDLFQLPICTCTFAMGAGTGSHSFFSATSVFGLLCDDYLSIAKLIVRAPVSVFDCSVNHTCE
jgi:hypothetical protein